MKFMGFDSGTRAKLIERLTPRECEVLRELTDGKPEKEIADVLDLSCNTVRAHIGRIYKTLDVRNNVQAARVAVRSGFVKA